MNKLPRLIGIHGHAGVGKDTIAMYLNEWYIDCYCESFASPLKDAASQAFGIPRFHFDQSEIKELDNPYWNVSPRKIAQFLGTEMFRETIAKLIPEIGNDFWVKRLEGKLTQQILLEDEGEYNENDCVVIPDVRFQNEYDWITGNNGIVIHLTRAGKDGNIGIPNHASESGIFLNAPSRTYTISNNSSIGDLYNEVDRCIETFPYLNLVKKSS